MALNKKYKRNYLDAVKNVIPTFYFAEDFDISGYKTASTDELVNSHINFCINQPSLLNISAVPNSFEYSSINVFSGIAPYFVVDNNTTHITARDFELNIMHPLGHCIGEYTGQTCTFFTGDNAVNTISADKKAEFINFLSGTLLPKITLNSDSLATTTASAFDNTASGTHTHLIKNLGWAYFLNTSGADTSYSPSSYVASAIADAYFDEAPFDTLVGIKGLQEYIWYGWSTLSATYPSLMPTDYASGVGTYVSGIQNLDALKTLVDVVYSTDYLSEGDTYVKDALDSYSTTNSLLEGQELAAPFSRYLQAVSYSLFDTNNDVSKLKSLYDLERCPDNLLPYLGDLIGWQVYGSNPDSWRRQIRGAVDLYKSKGTKQGLFDAITTVLPTVTLETSAISEFYESYIPYLLYYLLKTDTTVFDSFDTFTFKKAQDLIPDDYSSTDMDENIRKVIDWMLFKAAYLYFPDLFFVGNYKFDFTDPEFRFFYRGRVFPVPPWEEEKFYKNCDVTEELATFFERELVCLGVAESNALKFKQYILNNTVKGSQDAKFYDNGFLFLTSSLNQPPNRDSIIEKFEVQKFDYLSLWNGKSSHFDVDVSSGTFDSDFFLGEGFIKSDFFESLAVIDKFSPAKAIARSRVSLDHTDNLNTYIFNCPSVRYWLEDLPASGAHAGAYDTGVSFIGIPGAFGSDYPTPANSSRSRVNHSDKPVFRRESVNSPYDFGNLAGSSVSAEPLNINVFRNAMRRRNFSKVLEKGGLYTRTGFNMPSYFNTSSAGADPDVEYQALGLLNLIFKYHNVINPYDLYEVSSFPYNLDVWTKCWNLDSDNDMSGIFASATFDIRGQEKLEVSKCNPYVARDRTPEFYTILQSIFENNVRYEADYVAQENKFLTNVSSFLDASTSYYNYLINTRQLSEDDMFDSILGQRRVSRGSLAGIHKTFRDFIDHYGPAGLGNYLLTEIGDGGLNILSHAYGPLLYNAKFNLEGSAVDASVSSQLIANTISEEYPFSVKDLTSLNNITASTAATDIYVGGSEYRNPYILSGVEFTDSIQGTSKFSIFNLDPSTTVRGASNYLVDNPIVLWKPEGGLPRLRYSVKDYGPLTNLFVPEHDFEFELRAMVGTQNSKTLGNGAFGVWIHTDIESDYYGSPVVWTFMPNGKWEMTALSSIQSSTGANYVKNNLSHVLDYEETFTTKGELGTGTLCILKESDKDVLVDITKDDFQSRAFKFNTRNAPISVPLGYYQSHNQVHRSDQRYIIEIFMFDNPDVEKFGMADYISVKDTTQLDRLKRKYSFSYNDYSKGRGTGVENFVFLDDKGESLEVGTELISDIDGNITKASDGTKVTFKEANSFGDIISKYILYSQSDIKTKNKWTTDANGTAINIPSKVHIGNFHIGASSTILPDTITITGKTKGSNIVKEVTEYIPYTSEETMGILREFDRLRKGTASRNPNVLDTDSGGVGPEDLEETIGPEGGSRLNYRVSPTWEGNYTKQYTRLNLEN